MACIVTSMRAPESASSSRAARSNTTAVQVTRSRQSESEEEALVSRCYNNLCVRTSKGSKLMECVGDESEADRRMRCPSP